MISDINNEVSKAIKNIRDKYNPITEDNIEEYVFVKLNQIRGIMGDELLTEDELNLICASVKRKLSFTVSPGDVLTNSDFESWYYKEKINYEMFYWDRYKIYLELDQHFVGNVVNNIDDVTDQLTDLIGNPNVNYPFQRRGLIIGDVQSGKTSNFIGLMCKAADIGYKLIVVLASTTDKLRTQTQERVDEGFIGYDSDKLLENEAHKIGSANYSDSDTRPLCVTSKKKDFNKNIANQLGLQLSMTTAPIVFVIKKNVSVLNNLNKWIKSLNQADKDGKINSSLLVVDDEADYASINTNSDDKDPTKTNARIQELLSIFKKASYVGFTATPYANVFIDPDTNEHMTTAPLFPRDYIYCLDSPSNYIGARNVFGDYIDPSVKTIEDDEENEHSIYSILPIKHKKDADFTEVPDTLKAAIQEFFIANVIRDLRGEKTSHRSMLINISRFVNVHKKIKKQVESYVNLLKKSIVFYSKLDDDTWKSDYNMMCLYNIYQNDYAKTCENVDFCKENGYKPINWEDVKNAMHDATSPIVVRVVNQASKDDMDYKKHEEEGLRVIAIGGIALSRGLTLYGLTISYFFRSTNTYDTLMQMGRWFGYREGYRDLCRIWLTDSAQECYVTINRATEELRDDIIQYKNSGLTPMDFGIRVRTDNNMLITARNKMRTAKNELVECSLSSKVVETRYLINDEKKIADNYYITHDMITKALKDYDLQYDKDISTAQGFKNVDYSIILEYLSDLNISIANIEFDNEALSKFIKDNLNMLSKWDIAIMHGNGKENDEFILGQKINYLERQIDIKPGTKLIRVSGVKCRVGGPADGRFGLNKSQLESISPLPNHKQITQTQYFDMGIVRNPLLAIYLIQPNPVENLNTKGLKQAKSVCEYCEQSDIPLVAVSIGIPNLGKEEIRVMYAINKIAQALKESDFDEDFEGDTEDDQ